MNNTTCPHLNVIFSNDRWAEGMLYFLLFVGGPTFSTLFYGWQVWDRAHRWRSIEAVTVGSDYSEAERLDDTRPFASLRLHPFSDGKIGQYTKVRIDYADATGRHHQATVDWEVRRGKTVMAHHAGLLRYPRSRSCGSLWPDGRCFLVFPMGSCAGLYAMAIAGDCHPASLTQKAKKQNVGGGAKALPPLRRADLKSAVHRQIWCSQPLPFVYPDGYRQRSQLAASQMAGMAICSYVLEPRGGWHRSVTMIVCADASQLFNASLSTVRDSVLRHDRNWPDRDGRPGAWPS